MKKSICILVLCVFVFSGLWADVAPKFAGWKQAETEHFRFVYEAASKEAAEAYARIADEAYQKVAEIYGLPEDKLTVYVVGRTNTIDAMTMMPPLAIIMYTTPFVVPDFTYRDDWVKFVFTHELIHAANMNFESRKSITAELFGEYFRMMEVQSMNGWEMEGLTTVLETELSNAGRGRSPYFELLYKAPAMEGCLLSYDEIGLQKEPPNGQIYVYGYLLMRSLADRWGLDTLADIERNRASMSSYDDAISGITGESPQTLWRDVKIALTKRYAAERAIPEGKIISPRDDYYYKPAAILDDGTFITLRGANVGKSVVLVNPALPSGEAAYDELYGSEPTVKETVLFYADVPDQYSITADGSGKVYGSLACKRADRAPGTETEYRIFTWDRDNGLVQLTAPGSSFFQPSVSRDGSTLVALEQKGMKMRVVQIDTVTGAVTPIIDDPAYDFAMPALNADGSKLALLRAGGGRGAVALFDMKKAAAGCSDAGALTIVANGSGDIVDPAYPAWDSDGTLNYCCNTRGRLEVFAVAENADGTFTSTPVVSDPVGALWAYKTDRGIYYGSYSASGYSIKMKPLSEWGVVPDWNGPSMPGDIISPASLEVDYLDYKPYENGDIWDSFEVRDKELYVNEDTIRQPVTELQNERKFILKPATLMRLPLVTLKTLPDEKLTFGFGGFALGTSSPLMGRSRVVEVDAEYYPKINNFSGNAGFETEINNSVLDLFVSRQLETVGDGFSETNYLIAGFGTPFYNRSTPVSAFEISSITTLMGGIIRSDDEAFAVNDDIAQKYALSAAAGFGLSGEKWNPSQSMGTVFTSSTVALINWDNTLDKFFYGAESDVDVLFGDGEMFGGFYLQGRYLDAPASLDIGSSTMKHGGYRVDATNPFNMIARFEAVSNTGGMLLNFYEEGLCSLTKAGNFTFDDILATGFEASLPLGHDSVAGGFTFNYSRSSEKFSFGQFYFTIKMNFMRM